MRYQMVARADRTNAFVLIDDRDQARVMDQVWNELAERGAAPAVTPSIDALLASADLRELADRLEKAFDRGEPLPEDARPVVPIRAGDVFCIGRNYAEHARELGSEISREPVVFMKPRGCLIASGEPVILPEGAGEVHYEGEIVLVIGEDLRGDISPDRAREAVFGVTLMNDVTDRARQTELKAAGKPWLAAKGRSSFGPCGPSVRRLDAQHRVDDLTLQTRVNGEVRQSGGSNLWLFPLPALVVYLARTFGLRSGDMIATGTPAGVGPLKSGDRVEVACSAVGVLSNPVIEEQEGEG